MSKRTVYTLSDEDVCMPIEEQLENTAVLAWRTSYTAFTFAFYLNQIFHMELRRCNDIQLSSMKEAIRCSVYSYSDPVDHLNYFLIENNMEDMQSVKALSYFDKMLLVNGAEASERADAIDEELKAPMRHHDDILGTQYEEMRHTFVETGIIESARFDFTDAEIPTASILDSDSGLSKKQQNFLQFYRDYIQGILIEIDDLIQYFE
jgi:hypothetical protein